ncbi:DUF5681 domain-containing protein [Ruegeria sp. HKCCC2117]|uniref:DUF5681 domain-containing protein n=1 Tax=Ruegeria sp. HKCCC2117 TaxID=2682992 RepID=UPI001488D39F|nr:DUF5681 domain-containing protein [Ruegeria sp. HKCCC2117]
MSDKDYEVGHGRPPKHTQFKKGQSGNPKGRKKGARGLKTDLRAELNERVEVKEQGKVVRMTKQQLMVKQFAAKAIKGDVRAISKLVDVAMDLLGPDDEPGKNTVALPADDQAIINEFLSRQVKDAPDE